MGSGTASRVGNSSLCPETVFDIIMQQMLSTLEDVACKVLAVIGGMAFGCLELRARLCSKLHSGEEKGKVGSVGGTYLTLAPHSLIRCLGAHLYSASTAWSVLALSGLTWRD